MRSLNLCAAIAVALLATACTRKEDPAPVQTSQPSVTQSPKEETREKPTVAEALEAIRRAHPHSIQSCWDERNDGFFIEYSVQPDDAEPDKFMHGWKYLKADKLYKASNGTWFTQEREEQDYVNVYPDVTGLPCKKT